MFHFLQANWATIVTLLVITFLVFLAIRKIVKDKKAGIGACGHKCADCPHAANCHHDEPA